MTSCAKKIFLTAFFFGSTALWLGLAGLNWSNLSIMELGLLPWLDCPWLVWLTLLMPRSWKNLRYDLNFNSALSDKLYMWYSISATDWPRAPPESCYVKGQLISKCLFWCLHFLPKINKNKSTSSKVEFVRSFFGRNVGLKKSFRICMTFSNLDRVFVVRK